MTDRIGLRRAEPGRGSSSSHRVEAQPGRTTLTMALSTDEPAAAAVQRKAAATPSDGVPAAAAHGVSGSAAPLPHLDRIQRLFGRHDVSHVRAHTDGAAAEGSRAMGAQGYAVGDRVAFDGAPGLHLAAHEAAHVVQQRGGVQLAGGVGRDGDEHEAHADAVADRVVRGESAEGLLDRYAGGSASGAAVQRKPVVDARHGAPFYEDDKKRDLKLKLTTDGADAKDFHIRNQLQPLYWTSATEDAYYTDTARTAAFDVDGFLTTHRFGAWLETYQEASHEHAKIDLLAIDPTEKARRKNAIAMYLLQEFIVNALYRADELTRLDYQASPLNYQENSAYVRSFATSYVNRLQAVIGTGYQSSKLLLTRNDDFPLVLDKFFEVARVAVPDPDGPTVMADIATTIRTAASYVYETDHDLQQFWDVPGNTQAFVDVTPVLAGKTAQERHAITEKIGRHVKRCFSQAVARELARLEADRQGKGPSSTFETQLGTALGEQVAVAEERDDVRVIRARNKGVAKTTQRQEALADRLLEDPVGRAKFKTWLDAKKRKTKPHRDFIAAIDRADLPAARTELLTFIESVYDDYLKSREVDKATLTEPGVRDAFDQLAPKAERAAKSVSSAVVTGGMVTLDGPGNAYQQPALVIDDPKIDMAVKTAINKSGNVPPPSDASRKMLSHEQLQDIVVGVLDEQRAKDAQKKLGGALDALRNKIVAFKPTTHPSVVAARDHLAATREAFEQLKLTFAHDSEAISLEARAAIKLIAESGALEDGRLPDFVLQQLAQHMQDAIDNRLRIEDHVRSIQGIHEAVMLALELDGKPRDATYDYGAPQHVELGETKDKYFQGAHVADYGLKAFAQAYDAAAAQLASVGQDKLDLVAFHNIYFELADKLRATRNTSKGGKVVMETPTSVPDFLLSSKYTGLDVKAQGLDVVLVDIHPNDATKPQIVSNNIQELIDSIFTKKQAEDAFRLTMIVDITLNHPGEDEVAAIRKAAQKYIAQGKLNLVFIQSLAKFPQLGMDKASGGLVLVYNDHDKWQAFNASIAQARTKDLPDPTTEKYLQALFKHAAAEQQEYLVRVRKNTQMMHEMLHETFAGLDIDASAIKIATNTDDGSCYVALRYDDFLAKIYAPEKLRGEHPHHFNVDVLEQGINELLRKTGLPVAMRFSFGFPVSNLGETGNEVRFTIGIEGKEQLQRYVDVLAYVNASLANKLKNLEAEEAMAQVKLGPARMDPLADPVQRKRFLAEITDPVHNMQELQDELRDLLKTAI